LIGVLPGKLACPAPKRKPVERRSITSSAEQRQRGAAPRPRQL